MLAIPSPRRHLNLMGQFGFKYSRTISSPVKAYLFANFDFNNHNLAVILNSSQSKTPVGNDGWIQNTLAAAEYAAGNGFTLITSIEMNTWEMAAYSCRANDGFQIIIVSVDSFDDTNKAIESITADFKLDPGRTGWLIYESVDKRSPKRNWLIRDELAIYTADTFIPVSIRPQSKLRQMTEPYLADPSRKLIAQFRTEYAKPIYERLQIPDKPGESIKQLDNDYVIHWTRTCNGPMTGQTSFDYYRNIAKSEDRYCCSALNVLLNILDENKLRASRNNLPDGIEAVAFSSNPASEMINLMRWRKRLVNWNFEPYGIAIKKAAAEKHDIQKVIYGDKKDFGSLPEDQKQYFQNIGRDKSDWQAEHEWRHIGDLDLLAIPNSAMKAIVANSTQVEIAKSQSNIDIIHFA